MSNAVGVVFACCCRKEWNKGQSRKISKRKSFRFRGVELKEDGM